MIYKITPPEKIDTAIQLPASKSISNRMLILNQLAADSERVAAGPINNLSDSDDTQVLLKALQLLQSSANQFDIGAAGTSMRFLTAYLAQRPGDWTITGSERMKNRPIQLLVDALRSLGADIDYLEKEGFPPLHIKGKMLQGGTVTMNGSVSSQYTSALMMIAPCMEQGLTLHLTGEIISHPYIHMTVGLMRQFGVSAEWNDPVIPAQAGIPSSTGIRIAPQKYVATPFTVESDWSAASYWYEIQALAENAKIELLGLEENSLQGDAKIAEIMKGLRIKSAMTNISCHGGLDPQSPAKTFEYDFVNEPDLAQTVVVTCCLLNQQFHFSGLQSLRIKETDRMAALQTELKKLGYVLTVETDSVLSWNGERCETEQNPVIATYEDHRMAMAFVPACLKLGEIRIANPEVVTKSYPNFWEDLKKAGFTVLSGDGGSSPL